MSAFGGKADLSHRPAKGPLIANTGHYGDGSGSRPPHQEGYIR